MYTYNFISLGVGTHKDKGNTDGGVMSFGDMVSCLLHTGTEKFSNVFWDRNVTWPHTRLSLRRL